MTEIIRIGPARERVRVTPRPSRQTIRYTSRPASGGGGVTVWVLEGTVGVPDAIVTGIALNDVQLYYRQANDLNHSMGWAYARHAKDGPGINGLAGGVLTAGDANDSEEVVVLDWSEDGVRIRARTGELCELVLKNSVTTADATYTADGTETFILTAGSAVVLADPGEIVGQRVAIVAGGGNVTVAVADGGTILGQPSFMLAGGGNAVTLEAVNATAFGIGPTWAAVGTTGTQFNIPDFVNTPRAPGLILGIDGDGRPAWADLLGDYSKTADLGGAAFLNVGTAAGTVAAGDAAPNAHAASHAAGGSDPIPAVVRTNLLITGQYARTGNRTADATVTGNRLYYVPIMVDDTRTFDRVAVNHVATSAGASSVMRIGIYANTAGNIPGSLLLDCGSIDLSTAAGFKPLTINQQLTRGLWWLGAVAQLTSGSPTFAVAPPFVQVPDLTNVSSGTLFENGVTGSLPSTATPGTSVATQPPLVFLRPT